MRYGVGKTYVPLHGIDLLYYFVEIFFWKTFLSFMSLTRI